jgi:hypothetical protein
VLDAKAVVLTKTIAAFCGRVRDPHIRGASAVTTEEDEKAAWRRIRREESGVSSRAENLALESLAQRLRQDDWNIAAGWASYHWCNLATRLRDVHPRDQDRIDSEFLHYQATNRLLIEHPVEPPHRPAKDELDAERKRTYQQLAQQVAAQQKLEPTL